MPTQLKMIEKRTTLQQTQKQKVMTKQMTKRKKTSIKNLLEKTNTHKQKNGYKLRQRGGKKDRESEKITRLSTADSLVGATFSRGKNNPNNEVFIYL